MKLFDDPEEERKIWEVRESGLGATARVPGDRDTWEGWEDSAVPPERIGDYLRDLRKLLHTYGYNGALYGHFGQGCIHTRIDFDLLTAEGIAHYRSFMNEAADLVVSYGGSLSGEHGDGQSRAELLPKMFSPRLMQAFREFKAIWDPENKMNPGKLIDAYRMDENLRLGVDYDPPAVKTWFQFPEDSGSFARATTRCVGVGKCRNPGGGTMCPSFQVTREEKDSTRGRAHLLFEMLEGNPMDGGWQADAVHDALDLCLACKGCKGECPVNVDMATLKAEFYAHYYRNRLRPRSAYAMGLIYWWARAAARAPWLANFFSQAPGLSSVAKVAAGVSQKRRLPKFAQQTFRNWYGEQRPRKTGAAPRVLLFPDTFNNNFFPETAKAGLEVLEALGFDVIVPPRNLCCGRPLYDFGMLGLAKRQLRQILQTLRPLIREGLPMVVLEPSCLAVFRDEMGGLFPHDIDARRLSERTYLLSEFIEKFAEDHPLPHIDREALVHGHCHQKALIGMSADTAVLDKMGIKTDMPETGCCGMAGSFGFEATHYDVSVAVGERVLLPAVREADGEKLIIADGFSCREQIAQTTNRRALHLADVLAQALRDEHAAQQRPEAARAMAHAGRR